MTLQAQIDQQKIGMVRWYGKREGTDFPVPTFGKQGLEVDGQLIDPVGGLPLLSPFNGPTKGERRSGLLEHADQTRAFPIMDETMTSHHVTEVAHHATDDLQDPEVTRG
jgi:NADH-quinone oxidoreductase subunit B